MYRANPYNFCLYIPDNCQPYIYPIIMRSTLVKYLHKMDSISLKLDRRQEYQPGLFPRPAGRCRDHRLVRRRGSRSPLCLRPIIHLIT